MLPARHRLRDSATFRATTRHGRRQGGRSLVLHLDLGPGTDSTGPPRVGLVVSRAVGGSVVRNTVKRRLRHLLRERLAMIPAGAVLVVRALPAAAGASSADLGRELDRSLARLLPMNASGGKESVAAS